MLSVSAFCPCLFYKWYLGAETASCSHRTALCNWTWCRAAACPSWLCWGCCSSHFSLWSVKKELGDCRVGVVLISGKQAQKLSLWGSDLNHILALNGAKVCLGLAQTPRSSSAVFCVISRPPPAKSQCQRSYVGLSPAPKSWGFWYFKMV